MPRDLLDAGATVVAVGTESFRDPLAGARIATELAADHSRVDAAATSAAFPATCGILRPVDRRSDRRHSTYRLDKTLQKSQKLSTRLDVFRPQLEVEANSARIG